MIQCQRLDRITQECGWGADAGPFPSTKENTVSTTTDTATHEYAFDCTLVCAIRVRAESPEAAAAMVRAEIDGAEANLGQWPNGDPILCEVSVEGDLDLFEVDGNDQDGPY
jgi:hypothetical protein